MNAHALLSAQGWRGTGHSLHKTDDSIGLAKPLLLSRKDNTLGLGQKQHFTSDQWWMNAFDEQLKGLDTSKEGKVVQTVTTGKLNGLEKGMGKWSVYTTFVRGGFLEGTINKLFEKDATSTESDEDDSDEEVVKTMVAPKQDEDDDEAEEEAKKETKEERRARKEAKRKRKEERAREKAARRERKKNKSRKSSSESSDADEEKRRRRAKKERKRKERLQAAEKKSV